MLLMWALLQHLPFEDFHTTIELCFGVSSCFVDQMQDICPLHVARNSECAFSMTIRHSHQAGRQVQKTGLL